MRVSAYEAGDWHDLGVATAGAAAALTGLLFVAVSINLRRILQFPLLPGRAGGTLGLLLALLLVSMFLITPGQSNAVLGGELAVTGLALATGAVLVAVRSDRADDDPRRHTLTPLAILLVPAIALLAAGVSLAAEHGGGLYWLLGALVFGFTGAILNAWVFLVEIER